MRRINKNPINLPEDYQKWLDENEVSNKNFRDVYDDIVMNLYKCQQGMCAYTEAFICPPDLYADNNWETGSYVIVDETEFTRVDHRGQLEHFDPENKKVHYWNWSNLFMIDAKINGLKSNKPVYEYLKPDLNDYTPEKYFDYDETTHRFIPNTDIEDSNLRKQIKYMIDEVLYLNHGVVRKDRENYINELKDKKKRGQNYNIDRFFTSVAWTV